MGRKNDSELIKVTERTHVTDYNYNRYGVWALVASALGVLFIVIGSLNTNYSWLMLIAIVLLITAFILRMKCRQCPFCHHTLVYKAWHVRGNQRECPNCGESLYITVEKYKKVNGNVK